MVDDEHEAEGGDDASGDDVGREDESSENEGACEVTNKVHLSLRALRMVLCKALWHGRCGARYARQWGGENSASRALLPAVHVTARVELVTHERRRWCCAHARLSAPSARRSCRTKAEIFVRCANEHDPEWISRGGRGGRSRGVSRREACSFNLPSTSSNCPIPNPIPRPPADLE